MNRNNENKLIPRLRFPEFVDSGEWDLMPIGNILNAENSTLALNKLDLKLNGYGVYGADGIIGYIDNFQHKDRYISIVKDGSGVGRLNLCEEETSALGTLSVLKSRDERKYKLTWMFYLLNTVDFSSYVKGSGIPHIYFSDYKNKNIGVPPLPEQQRIAACLSSLDDLITGERKKLELLREHKKGLLQQLFPQGSEAIPKLRFKEFENSGEWEVKKLGEVAEKVGSGVTPLGGESNYKKSGKPFVRSQNVGWGVFLLDEIVFIDEETHRNQISTELMIEDVLLNITGASIGRSAVVNKQVEGGNVNQHVCIIRAKNTLNPFFLNQYIVSDYGQKQIDNFQAGGNRQGLNFAQIRSFSIPIPSIKEQQKIAACLTSLDELIRVQAGRIEQLALHKKGLLQGLFPVLED